MIFNDLKIGDIFQLINNTVGEPVPGTPIFEKIENELISNRYKVNAKRTDTGVKVRVKEEMKIKLIKSELKK